ncbi:hypothetical protein P8452_65208 [Trifolium repens]|nr:hypothetical protein P8452_65208 [Trifolium repens]
MLRFRFVIGSWCTLLYGLVYVMISQIFSNLNPFLFLIHNQPLLLAFLSVVLYFGFERLNFWCKKRKW